MGGRWGWGVALGGTGRSERKRVIATVAKDP